ncbi:MAG: L-histidine N(alpha)-methyltransferase, partial [Patescibacteria group bacterium]
MRNQNDEKSVFMATPELLKMVKHFIKQFGSNKKFNLIDLGPGNSYHTKILIDHFVGQDCMGKCVSVDISKEMLSIAQESIKKDFPTVEQASFILDYEVDDLGKIAREVKTPDSVNVILLIGSTFGNLSDETILLKNVANSLENNDLFLFTNRLDRHDNLKWNHLKSNNKRYLFIPELLGIDTSKSQYSLHFDIEDGFRKASIALEKSYQISSNYTDIFL